MEIRVVILVLSLGSFQGNEEALAKIKHLVAGRIVEARIPGTARVPWRGCLVDTDKSFIVKANDANGGQTVIRKERVREGQKTYLSQGKPCTTIPRL